jgi:hypothetical protein
MSAKSSSGRLRILIEFRESGRLSGAHGHVLGLWCNIIQHTQAWKHSSSTEGVATSLWPPDRDHQERHS